MPFQKIDKNLLREFYLAGTKLADIAEYFGVSEVAVHYALKAIGVKRDRLNNPEKHSQSVGAIRSRLYRAQIKLEQAVADNAPDHVVRKYADIISRERKNLNGTKT